MGVNPQALISSLCGISIPASMATSKFRYLEEEGTLISGQVMIPEDEVKEVDNVLHAFSNGAWLSLLIAGCIRTNLLCIIALAALINALLGWFAISEGSSFDFGADRGIFLFFNPRHSYWELRGMNCTKLLN